MRFSASRLKTWQDCQLKARFQYVDMLPRGPMNAKASFGTCIHHALELYNTTGNYDLAVNTFIDVWTNPEKLGVAPDTWPYRMTFGSLKERGLQVLRDYKEKTKWNSRTVLATEHEFWVPFGEHELHGFVDLLELQVNAKGVELLKVVDYKTNAKKPNKAELALDLQFTVYMFAVNQPEFWNGIPGGIELYNDLIDTPRRAVWYQLMDAVEIDAGPRDDDDFMRMYRLCEQIAAVDKAGIHVPHIGNACLYCPFTEPCGVEIPDPETLREQDDAWL